MLASPLPATYGGAIDQWWRLRLLHKAGVRLWLHIFLSEGETEHPELLDYAERVFYYHRTRPLFTWLPFTVASRPAEPLLTNLLTGPSDILFEGVHTTAALAALHNHNIFLRLHNVEWRYHLSLWRSAPFSRRAPYHLIEALRLWHYERHLPEGLTLLPINADDEKWFRKHYPKADIRLMPPCLDNKQAESYDTLPTVTIKRPYILYHGNLSLPGSHRAARLILSELDHLPLVFAGRNPPAWLYKKECTVIANPPEREMTALIRDAAIVLMPSFQKTGTELKFLTTIAKARGHIVVNETMLHGLPRLRQLVHVGIDYKTVLPLLVSPPGLYEYNRRQRELRRYNDISALINNE